MQVVPHEQQSAGVKQYRDMVDRSLEDKPLPQPQRPAATEEVEDADEEGVQHIPEGVCTAPCTLAVRYIIPVTWQVHPYNCAGCSTGASTQQPA